MDRRGIDRVVGTRRTFLMSTGLISTGLAAGSCPWSANAEVRKAGDTYETHAVGIRILPGAWRPHYPWEHIAWVSPPWPSQDYIWLDFPEAIFTSQGLIFLSHVNPPISTVFHNLPPVAWKQIPGGISFERTLPNGIALGGSVTCGEETTVDLELHLKNGSAEPLDRIKLQTCAYLRAIEEFADFSQNNKFVHVADEGWIPMDQAAKRDDSKAKYRIGWGKGKLVADLPAVVVVSNDAKRLAAMTWFEDTFRMVGNPRHPCFHADPRLPDLAAGERASIRGKLIFFEGSLADFDLELL